MQLSAATLADLRKSGLNDATIEAAQIGDLETPDWQRSVLRRLKAPQASSVQTLDLDQNPVPAGVQGYVIPYQFDDDASQGFYRIKLLNPDANIKYVQSKTTVGKTSTQIYFPPNLPALWSFSSTPLLITEGEKKALKACQEGYACIAVGGVWNWKGKRDGATTLAEGLEDIDWNGRQVVLIYDNDKRPHTRAAVQQAAFEFGIWLEDKGAKVHQFFLPTGGQEKMALDDFLQLPQGRAQLAESLERLNELIFPPPGDAKSWARKNLADKRDRRSGHWKAIRGIIADLDNQGKRYKDTTGNLYYFDSSSLVLHQFVHKEIAGSTFADLLVDRYGLRNSDRDAMMDFGDLFTAVQPCPTITPHRVLSNTAEAIYYQLSDSKLAKIASTSIRVLDNGTDDQLFLSGAVAPVDIQALRAKLSELGERPSGSLLASANQSPLWLDVLQTVNLQELPGLTIEQTRQLICCLFYMSPWLLRWRGTQLPLEIAVAEPNSGKTFLFNLRKGVLTGFPTLQGMPNDFRAFVSSIQSAPGMWVCDNLGHMKNDYWEQLNAELARIITDPDPVIELRQLYTTATVVKIPIQCSFAITCINNPLTKPDLIQRSLVFELQAIPAGQRNSNWYTNLLGRRTEFLAEQLQVLQSFLASAERNWKPNYLSGYRLVNFEQSLVLIGEVLGFDMGAIVKALPNLVTATIVGADITIQALKDYAASFPDSVAQVSDVVAWALSDPNETYSRQFTVTNAIRLGRYIKAHTDDIRTATGITIDRQNNTTYLHIPKELPK